MLTESDKCRYSLIVRFSAVPPKPIGGFHANRGVRGQEVQIRPNLVFQQLPDLKVPQHSQPTLQLCRDQQRRCKALHGVAGTQSLPLLLN
ncbi:MAG: hypothetical protein ACLQBK_11940 [Candidatus Sulfotelmatobacter sp.]